MNSRLERMSHEFRPDRESVKRFSKDKSNPIVAQERSEASLRLLRARANYLERRREIDDKLAESGSLKDSFPEVYASLERLRDRMRADYEREHADIIERFLDNLEREYQAIPMTEEEISTELSAEHLASLSLKEYVELLRRLPPRFFTHVTRQGIRETNSFHSSGRGKFHNGFKGILESGAVTSIRDQLFEMEITKEAVRAWIQKLGLYEEKGMSRADAVQAVEEVLTKSPVVLDASGYADARAIHAALEHVADEIYGGETGNQLFFVWPVALVAKEYHIGKQSGGVPDRFAADDRERVSPFNDYWLLRKDTTRGSLPVDAGIAFVPKDARVGRETGSKYEIDADGNSVPNRDLKPFLELMKSKELAAIIKNLQSRMQNLARLDSEQLHRETNEGALGEAAATYRRLCAEYGITDQRIIDLVDSSDRMIAQSFWSIQSTFSSEEPDYIKETNMKSDLLNLRIEHQLATDTVSSQEYWEAYFEKAGKRPVRVVYYEGSNPSEALEQFKRVALLDKATSAVDLAKLFEDNIVGPSGITEILKPEADVVRRFAAEIINETFPEAVDLPEGSEGGANPESDWVEAA